MWNIHWMRIFWQIKWRTKKKEEINYKKFLNAYTQTHALKKCIHHLMVMTKTQYGYSAKYGVEFRLSNFMTFSSIQNQRKQTIDTNFIFNSWKLLRLIHWFCPDFTQIDLYILKEYFIFINKCPIFSVVFVLFSIKLLLK